MQPTEHGKKTFMKILEGAAPVNIVHSVQKCACDKNYCGRVVSKTAFRTEQLIVFAYTHPHYFYLSQQSLLIFQNFTLWLEKILFENQKYYS